MTCIVGIEADSRVFVGADSAYTDGQTQGLVSRDDGKLWRTGDYLLGVAGSPRVSNLLRFMELPPAPTRGLFRHMVLVVVPLVRKALRSGGRMLKDRDVDPSGYGVGGGDASDGVLLVGVRGKVYTIHSDFQVCRARAGYDAIGSGGSVAMGALCATADIEPKERVRIALTAAETHACGVKRPWRILTA